MLLWGWRNPAPFFLPLRYKRPFELRRSEIYVPLGSGSFSTELNENQVAYLSNGELVGSDDFVFNSAGLVLNTPIVSKDSFQIFKNNNGISFFPPPSLLQSYSLYLPNSQGSSGSVLMNLGGGVLDWASSTAVLTANNTLILAGNPKSVLFVNAEQKLAQSEDFLYDYSTGYLSVFGYTVSGLAPSSSFLKGNGSAFITGYITNTDLPSGIDAAKIADGSISNTEFQYLNNASSNIQNQLDNKQTLDATLTALALLDSSSGAVFQTGADSFIKKQFFGTTSQINLTEDASSLTFSLPTSLILDSLTTNIQLLANRSLGDSNYAAVVTHSGGISNRHGLQVVTSGDSTNTTAFNVSTGSNSLAIVTDGAGNTGFGLTPSGAHRLQIRGGGNTSATDAIRVSNSDTTTIFQLQNNGYLALGATSSVSKFTLTNTASDTTIGGIQSTVTFTGTDSTSRTNYGLSGALYPTTNVSAAHTGYGLQFTIAPIVASGATNSGNNAGVFVNSSITSPLHAGVLVNSFGGYFRHGASSAATGSGSITNSWGLYVLSDFGKPSSFGIGTSYGLQILGTGTTSYPTAVWGLYEGYATAVGAANYLSSPLLIGTTTKNVAALTVARAGSGSAWGTAGVGLRLSAFTATDTSSVSGNVNNNAVHSIATPTLAASNATVNYLNAHTLYITNPPAAGTNVTISNPWAFYVNVGHTRLMNTYIGGSTTWGATNPNTNILSGSGFVGLQIRNSSSVNPALEFFVDSNSISDAGTIGRIGFWGGNTTPRENARIEALVVGTSENAANLIFSTATAGTLTERLRIGSTGTITVTGFAGGGTKVVLADTNGALSALASGTTAQYLRGDGTWQTPAGTGTVTSVALSLPAQFTVTGSPVTASGTLSATWANQASGVVFAGPSSGASTTPAFRELVAGDIPNLPWSKITSGLPTTLAGYGITDAQGLDATLTALAGLDSSAGLLYQTGADAFTKVSSGVFSASGHTHAFADLTSKPTTFAGYGITETTSNLGEGSNLYYTDARVRACTLTGFASSNSVVTSSDTVLESIGKLQGQISSKKERRTLVFFSAYTPTASGADDVEIPIPRLSDGGTNWTPKKLRVRVKTASAGTTTVRCEYYNGTGSFSATNIHTGGDVSLSGGSTYEASTTTFSTTTLASEGWIRINFTSLDSTHAKFTIYLEIEEQ